MFVRSLMCLRYAYEASLRVQLGAIAFKDAHYNEAVEHFAAAVKASNFLATLASPSACKVFTVVRRYDAIKHPFHALMRGFCSYSDGSSSHCGKPPTRNCVLHSSRLEDLEKPSNRTDMGWAQVMKLPRLAYVRGSSVSLSEILPTPQSLTAFHSGISL
jgi:hypothetical protein